MDNKEYEALGLYEHNIRSFEKVKDAFLNGQDIVGIVHATGTGKSFNALQIAYESPDASIIYVVPSVSIIEHLKEIIESNPNLSLEKDFPNLRFITYTGLINMNHEEMEELDCDLLILDEFHHIGAPVWGAKVDEMLETHPEMKIFGMTAYTVRDRGTSYERDMANPDTNEIFSNKIVSRYDLEDAIIEGVLPKPVYKSAYFNAYLLDYADRIEETINSSKKSDKEKEEYIKIITDAKKRIHEAPTIPEIFKRNLKEDGKYIYFCPPVSEDGVNDIETIKNETIEKLRNFIPEDQIEVYITTSEMGKDGKLNRDAFYHDKTITGEDASNKFRIMFAINQYNEGVHAPNIDGVIMGRGTSSDIVFFEHLGRALAVRGNTEEKYNELDKYTYEELIEMCKNKDIKVDDDTSKKEVIEKLLAPIILDLTNNYGHMIDLQDNLNDRIKERQEEGLGNERDIKIDSVIFDIEIENKDLFDLLDSIKGAISFKWEDWYDLARVYYEHYGNLEIPSAFKTTNGYEYDENGVKLGIWIATQRQSYKGQGSNKITTDQIDLLNQIGMRWDNIDRMNQWMEWYNLAKIYYEHYGNLEIPYHFKTTNGYEYDENGVSLGIWIVTQRKSYKGYGHKKITTDQIDLLNQIGMRWDKIDRMDQWMEWYNLAKIYYEHYGNLEIPSAFKTTNGYEYDENGVSLGIWIKDERQSYKGYDQRKITTDQIDLLNQIGMRWDNIDRMNQWMEWYNLAKIYYEHYGNLEMPSTFKTTNGYEYDENGVSLGIWIVTQRQSYKGYGHKKITTDQIDLLNQIGMNWNRNEDKWMEWYNLAKAYYAHHGNLNIPYHFKTTNGYEYDENGVKLGLWIATQRQSYKGYGQRKITTDQIDLLNQIGMNWNRNEDKWMEWYNLAKAYYAHHGNLNIPLSFKTTNGYEYDENGVKLGHWIENQRQSYKGQGSSKITTDQKELLDKIGIEWFKYTTDNKYQAEEITESNKDRKDKEILNRSRSLLNTYDGSTLPSKEEINNDFMDRLNRIK